MTATHPDYERYNELQIIICAALNPAMSGIIIPAGLETEYNIFVNSILSDMEQMHADFVPPEVAAWLGTHEPPRVGSISDLDSGGDVEF